MFHRTMFKWASKFKLAFLNGSNVVTCIKKYQPFVCSSAIFFQLKYEPFFSCKLKQVFSNNIMWGEELYTQMGFFVQSILADRYIHRRELTLVSLESLSSVEYGIKKIFSFFVFDREISRFNLSRK